MCSVTREECDTIVRTYLGHSDYKLIDYAVIVAEASLGLMSVVSSLKVKLSINDETKEVRFFIKFLPLNDYHFNIIAKAKCFKKESAFFGTLFEEMRSYLIYKSVPDCYLKDCEKMIVLEDLSMNGYRNCSNPYGFDLNHTYASIKALADMHSASLIYEYKIGKTLDNILPRDLLRPWFCNEDGFPGYKDGLAGANIICRVMDKYFQNYSSNTINKAKQLSYSFGNYSGSKSSTYRNVLAHQDLWCNNVMFKYNNDNNVTDAVLIDFQMFGYNPPSLDLLLLIYCDTEKSIRDKYMNELCDYHYKCISDNIKHHKLNPDDLLTKEEFIESMEETRPIALAAAPLFLHTVMTPEDVMLPVLQDIEKFKFYIEKDRSIVLETLENYEYYRTRVLTAVHDLLEFVEKSN